MNDEIQKLEETLVGLYSNPLGDVFSAHSRGSFLSTVRNREVTTA